MPYRKTKTTNSNSHPPNSTFHFVICHFGRHVPALLYTQKVRKVGVISACCPPPPTQLIMCEVGVKLGVSVSESYRMIRCSLPKFKYRKAGEKGFKMPFQHLHALYSTLTFLDSIPKLIFIRSSLNAQNLQTHNSKYKRCGRCAHEALLYVKAPIFSDLHSLRDTSLPASNEG